MRLRSVAVKTLHDYGRRMAWWVLGLGATIGMQVAVYPSIAAQGGYQDMLEQMPDAMKAIFGVESGIDAASASGYLQAEVFAFTAPLALLVFAIGIGGGLIGREEETGTLDLLLAYPVRRGNVVLQKFAAAAVLTCALAAALCVVVAVATTAADMDVALVRLAAAVASVAALGLFFCALALLATCLWRRRGVAYGVAAAVAVVGFLINSLAAVTDVLDPLRPLSPFRWAQAFEPLRTGFDAALLVVLAGTAALVWAAAAAFERRDLTT